MIVVIPTENDPIETRVSATPETIKKMISSGLKVRVQSGAGLKSLFCDKDYKDAGAEIVTELNQLYKNADIVLKVQKPIDLEFSQTSHCELSLIPEQACLIGLLQPLVNRKLVEELAKRKITALSMDLVPRIARAQRLDALSSQSSIAGYKAVIMAANALQKMMPMMMTAAGTIQAAKVLVIGAGVAGLQAVATAKRLGAIVEAFDTRPAVKEQVESLGGRFISLELEQETEDQGGYAKELSKDAHEREQEILTEHAIQADIIITTAQIPGKKAPILISAETVKKMRAGSVIVDLAIEGGGNCELSEIGKEKKVDGVTIIGYPNLPGQLAFQASQLYARNISGLLLDHVKDGELKWDQADEIIRGALVTENGKIVNSLLLKQESSKG
jgi:NAD(P) transhydrogenase subunit alpha